MKLQLKLRKTIALAVVGATMLTAMPVFASDYTGHWAEAAIIEWQDKGIIDGYQDGSFRPKEKIKRSEFAKMITKTFGLTHEVGTPTYTDVVVGGWYEDYVQVVSAAGLMMGTETGKFRPDEAVTREEAAYAIAKAYHVTGKTDKKYTDNQKISTWAAESVAALTANGYMSGYPEDGTFRPQGTLSRAEMVMMLDKITAEVIHTPGTYTGKTETIGNVIVNTKDVVLKDMVIKGNLYLAEGIGEGNVTLENVTVTGNVIVEGGGSQSIKVEGKSKLGNIIIAKAGDKAVRISLAAGTQVTGIVEVGTQAILEAKGTVELPKVIIKGAPTLALKGALKIGILDAQTKVEVKADSQVKVTTITAAPGVTKPQIKPDSKPSTGGGSGSGSSQIKPLKVTDVKINGVSDYVKVNGNKVTLDLRGFDGIIQSLQVETNTPAYISQFETLTDASGETLNFTTLESGKNYTVKAIINALTDTNGKPLYEVDTLVELGWLTPSYGLTLNHLQAMRTNELAADVLTELFGVEPTADGFKGTLEVKCDSNKYTNEEMELHIIIQ